MASPGPPGFPGWGGRMHGGPCEKGTISRSCGYPLFTDEGKIKTEVLPPERCARRMPEWGMPPGQGRAKEERTVTSLVVCVQPTAPRKQRFGTPPGCFRSVL